MHANIRKNTFAKAFFLQKSTFTEVFSCSVFPAPCPFGFHPRPTLSVLFPLHRAGAHSKEYRMGYEPGTTGNDGERWRECKVCFPVIRFACSKENIIFVVCYSVQFENYNYAGYQFIRVEEQHGEVS